jgi:asparaginyl-tRNA synthetase
MNAMLSHHAKIYIATAAILMHLRRALEDRSFLEILPSLLSRQNEPGARHGVAVIADRGMPDVDSRPGQTINHPMVSVVGNRWFYLPVSQIIERQMALEYADRVFCSAPCISFRDGTDEVSSCTNIEFEFKSTDINEILTVTEEVLASAALAVIREGPGGVFLSEGTDAARNLVGLVRTPYERITFDEAKQRVGVVHVGKFTPAQEDSLSRQFDRPFWVCDHPEGVRESLYRLNERGRYDTFDLMLPLGYGGLATGGVRADSAGEILRQSRNLSRHARTEVEKYGQQYAEWKERTDIQSAGFEIGLERLTRYCVGARSIQDVRQYHLDDPGPEVEAGPKGVIDPTRPGVRCG